MPSLLGGADERARRITPLHYNRFNRQTLPKLFCLNRPACNDLDQTITCVAQGPSEKTHTRMKEAACVVAQTASMLLLEASQLQIVI